MKIQYNNGGIDLELGGNQYRLAEIAQVYLVCDLVKWYRNQSENEQTYRAYTLILDSLMSAKEQMMRYCESECIRNWL